MGMDTHGIRTVPRLQVHVFLPWIFGEFFRWQALRDEGRLTANCGVHVASVISKLVSTTLPIRICNIPLRGRLSQKERVLYADSKPLNSTRIGIRRGSSRGINQERTAGATVEVFVRRSGLSAVRDHLRAARIRVDPCGCATIAKSCARDRESIAFAATSGGAGQRHGKENPLDSGSAVAAPENLLLPHRDFTVGIGCV